MEVPYNERMTIGDVLGRCLSGHPETTMTALAQDFGVSQATMSRWLAGKDIPTDRHVSKLAEYCELSETQVLHAIHRQRLERRTLVQRVASIETTLREISDRVTDLEGRPDPAALLAEIRAAFIEPDEGPPSPEPGPAARSTGRRRKPS